MAEKEILMFANADRVRPGDSDAEFWRKKYLVEEHGTNIVGPVKKEMFPDLLYMPVRDEPHAHGGYYAPHVGRPGQRGGSRPRDEEAEAPPVVYHGTSAKLVDTILKEGITPQQQHNITSLTYEGMRKNAVFVAESDVYAKIWSKDAIKNGRLDEIPGENKIRVAVFEISVPEDRRHELRVDPQEPNSLLLNDRIPPEWIKGYEIFTYDRKTKRFDPIEKRAVKQDRTYFVPIVFVETGAKKTYKVLLAKSYPAPHRGLRGHHGGSSPRSAGAALPSGEGLTELGDEDGSRAPKPGEPFIVFRLGSKDGKLEDRNAGNAVGVTDYIADAEDFEKAGAAPGDHINVYRVTTTAPFGPYVAYTGGDEWDEEQSSERVGRRAKTTYVIYSFPKSDTWSAERIASFPLADVEAYLAKKTKYDSFYMSGSIIGGPILREYLKEHMPKEGK